MSGYFYGAKEKFDSYENVLRIMATHESINSVRTSSLPLAQFWGVAGLADRLDVFKKHLRGVDLESAQKFFEFPTMNKKGKGKASMTDLMMFTDNHRIALEAKYTEYEKSKYEPVSSWNEKNEDNKNDVLDGWLSYMGKTKENIDGLGSIPYQLIHRIASAYADDGSSGRKLSPVVIYQLFYDSKTQKTKFEKFVKELKESLEKLELRELTFIAVKTKVTQEPDELGDRDSEYFLNMCESGSENREVYGPLTNSELLFYKESQSLEIKP